LLLFLVGAVFGVEFNISADSESLSSKSSVVLSYYDLGLLYTLGCRFDDNLLTLTLFSFDNDSIGLYSEGPNNNSSLSLYSIIIYIFNYD